MSKEHFGGHPIFEIILPERRIQIYANGVVEGCEGLQGRIISRIGRAIRPELLAYFSKWPYPNKSHEALPTRSPYTTMSPGIEGSGLSQGSGKNVANIPAQADAATGEK